MQARMRTGSIALALLAALFVLARPVCAAQDLRPASPHASAASHVHGSPQGSDHSNPCCDAMEASIIATSPALAVPTSAVALAVPSFASVHARIAPAHPALCQPPPPPLSYHARSARILR